MATKPHDVADLYLAPVVLALDTRIEELGCLNLGQLRKQVALASDTADWTTELREAALLESVRHSVDCHGWELSWDPRGLRLVHGSHNLVLGVPPVFTQFIDSVAAAKQAP